MSQKLTYQLIYRFAKTPEQLPWHQTTPPPFIIDHLADIDEPGRVLDIGCGSGFLSYWFAQRGWEVVGLDFNAAAVEMAKAKNADMANVTIVHADITQPILTEQKFDLLLDVGCLHGLNTVAQLRRYRRNILFWLKADGQFMLIHAEKRHRFDWRPIGPRRLPKHRILSLFQQDLNLIDQHSETRVVPLPIGPKLQLGHYCFKHQKRRSPELELMTATQIN